MTHECKQEKRIDDIWRAIFDNKDGIMQESVKTSTLLKGVAVEVAEIKSMIQPLTTYYNETRGVVNYKGKIVSKNRWLIGISLTFAGVIIALLTFIFTK